MTHRFACALCRSGMPATSSAVLKVRLVDRHTDLGVVSAGELGACRCPDVRPVDTQFRAFCGTACEPACAGWSCAAEGQHVRLCARWPASGERGMGAVGEAEVGGQVPDHLLDQRQRGAQPLLEPGWCGR